MEPPECGYKPLVSDLQRGLGDLCYRRVGLAPTLDTYDPLPVIPGNVYGIWVK